MRSFLFLTLIALAQDPRRGCGVMADGSYVLCSDIPGLRGPILGIADFIKKFFNFSLSLGGAVAFVLIVYGGLLLIFEAGNAAQRQEGKKTIWAAIIGLILLLGSTAVLFNLNPDLIKIEEPRLTGAQNVSSDWNADPLLTKQIEEGGRLFTERQGTFEEVNQRTQSIQFFPLQPTAQDTALAREHLTKRYQMEQERYNYWLLQYKMAEGANDGTSKDKAAKQLQAINLYLPALKDNAQYPDLWLGNIREQRGAFLSPGSNKSLNDYETYDFTSFRRLGPGGGARH